MFRHIQGLCLFQQVRSEMTLGFPYGAISSGFVCSDMFYSGIIISLQRGLKYSPKTSIFSPPSAYSLSKPHYCWYIKIKYTPDFIWISSVFPLISFFCARVQSNLSYYMAFRVQAFAATCLKNVGCTVQSRKRALSH